MTTTVLIVDDDPGIRRVVRLILKSEGFEVREAENGEAALAMCRGEHPSILLLDLNMPVMDGWELFRRLEADHLRPRTIVISASPSERERKALGAEASLQKPFMPEDLVEKVNELAQAA